MIDGKLLTTNEPVAKIQSLRLWGIALVWCALGLYTIGSSSKYVHGGPAGSTFRNAAYLFFFMCVVSTILLVPAFCAASAGKLSPQLFGGFLAAVTWGLGLFFGLPIMVFVVHGFLFLFVPPGPLALLYCAVIFGGLVKLVSHFVRKHLKPETQ